MSINYRQPVLSATQHRGIAGMFLLADLIARQRGKMAAVCVPGRRWALRLGWAGCFIGAIATAGLPPFQLHRQIDIAAVSRQQRLPGCGPLLFASFVVIVALSRAGSQLFWRRERPVEPPPPLQVLPYATAAVLTGSAVCCC